MTHLRFSHIVICFFIRASANTSAPINTRHVLPNSISDCSAGPLSLSVPFRFIGVSVPGVALHCSSLTRIVIRSAHIITCAAADVAPRIAPRVIARIHSTLYIPIAIPFSDRYFPDFVSRILSSAARPHRCSIGGRQALLLLARAT